MSFLSVSFLSLFLLLLDLESNFWAEIAMALFKKQESDGDFYLGVRGWVGGPPHISKVKGVPHETHREAYDVPSEMHYLFLISPLSKKAEYRKENHLLFSCYRGRRMRKVERSFSFYVSSPVGQSHQLCSSQFLLSRSLGVQCGLKCSGVQLGTALCLRQRWVGWNGWRGGGREPLVHLVFGGTSGYRLASLPISKGGCLWISASDKSSGRGWRLFVLCDSGK